LKKLKEREDNGYWGRIEDYISSHTGTDFSHKICPDCIEKYYPQLKKKNQETQELSAKSGN